MRLSLTILSEYLHLPETRKYLSLGNGTKYESIKLLEEQEDGLEKDILYLGAYMSDMDKISKEAGFIMVCSPDEWVEGRERMTYEAEEILFLVTPCTIEQILSSIWQIFFFFQQKELKISSCLQKEGGLLEICSIISGLVKNAVYMVDNSFKVLAMYGDDSMRQMSAVWKALEDVGYVPYSVIKNLIESRELDQMESQTPASLEVSEYFYTPFINYNLRYHERVQGHFFVIGMQKNISPGDVDIVDELGSYICQALLHNPDFAPTRGRGYEHFILDVMHGRMTDRKFIEERTSDLGMHMQGDFAVCLVDMLDAHEINCGYMARELERIMPGKPIIQENHIYQVVNLEKITYEKTKEELKGLISKFRCHIGISEPFRGFYHMQIYYRQAEMALQLAEKDEPFQVFSKQYLPLLSGILEKEAVLPLFICWEARMLLKQDEEKHTEMVQTFIAYLSCGRNTVHTAQKLHIHRNTLMYRLDKIKELILIDFDDITQINRIYLSLLLEQCRKK